MFIFYRSRYFLTKTNYKYLNKKINQLTVNIEPTNLNK